MLKEPRPGRVKTRLGASIGMVNAAWWFRHQTGALIRRLSCDPRWQTVLALSPDVEGLTSRVWPNMARWAQGSGDLGARMARIFRFGPKGKIIIIGADIPAIEARHIDQAAKALGSHDVVIGPAPDGGYWLIGWAGRKPVPPSLFKKIRWSTRFALEDSCATLGTDKIAYLEALTDVDEVEDLQI